MQDATKDVLGTDQHAQTTFNRHTEQSVPITYEFECVSDTGRDRSVVNWCERLGTDLRLGSPSVLDFTLHFVELILSSQHCNSSQKTRPAHINREYVPTQLKSNASLGQRLTSRVQRSSRAQVHARVSWLCARVRLNMHALDFITMYTQIANTHWVLSLYKTKQ